MRNNYDFSHASRNPYAKRLKKQITIRIDARTIDYFKGLAADTGMSYQVLMDLYLRDCAARARRPTLHWR